MFDTSVVRAHAISGPRRVTLFASILVHSIGAIALIALTVASTQLPQQPPRQFELYRPVMLPSAPPAPPPPRGVPAPVHSSAVAPPVLHVTAPAAIPDLTPVLPPDPGPGTGGTQPAGPETASGPIGDPLGEPGGTGTAVAGSGSAMPGPYTPGAGVTSARVLTRVEPRFPPAFVHGVPTAIVVVRCVIGQRGEIRDPEIVKSSFPPFNEAVLSALRQWTFAPGMMHGQPVDTWFELTVRFEVR